MRSAGPNGAHAATRGVEKALVDGPATFVRKQEIHGAHHFEACGIAAAGMRIAQIGRYGSRAVHCVLAMLLEHQLCQLPGISVVIHVSRRPGPLPDAEPDQFDQIAVFAPVIRITVRGDPPDN